MNLVIAGDDCLLTQAHDGLEEVVIEPHFVIELIERQGLRHGVEALIAQVSADQSKVLPLPASRQVFNEIVIVLLEGATAREMNTLDNVLPEAHKVVVEELTAVIGVDFEDRERKAGHLSSRSAERR